MNLKQTNLSRTEKLNPIICSILFLAVSTSLYASVTGGTIGNLFPAAKHTEGSIYQGVYSWQIANSANRFHIKIPQYADSYEFQYLQIKEQHDNTMSYVSFGPAAINHNIYRVSVIKKIVNVPFSIRAGRAANYITGTLIDKLHAKYKVLSLNNKIKFRNHQAAVAMAQLTTTNFSFINIVEVVDYPKYTILLSADFYGNQQRLLKIKNELVNGEYKPWNAFINSFNL